MRDEADDRDDQSGLATRWVAEALTAPAPERYTSIHHLRSERANLERLVAGGLFGDALSPREEAAIASLWRSTQHHCSNRPIEARGGPLLVTSGWAGWLRRLADGRRLVYLFIMPGDFIIPGLSDVPNCELISLTPLRTVDALPLLQPDATANPQSMAVIRDSEPRYRRLLLDHLTRLMMGSTTKGVASLLTEFHERSLRSGACVDGRFSFPIGQRMIAAALGRSTVQISKVISQFQSVGIIKVGYDWLEITDPERLRFLSGLTPASDSPVLQMDLLLARG